MDLHCHLLPGVDDGPETLDESVAYAAAVAAAGTTTAVATPHVELVDVTELPDRVQEVRDALRAEGIALHVEVGGELKPQSIADLDAAELELIAHGPPGARWLLYEVPFEGVDGGGGPGFLAGAQELHDRGYGLLLAHPERSHDILPAGLEALGPELLAGSVIAANVGPLTGRETPERHAASVEILRRGLVGVIATDAHAPYRPWTLAEGRAAVLAATGDAALADGLTAGNPAVLLRDGISVRGRAGAGGAAR
ncbi:MAG: protein-tyrosine phosphatase [Solirubrobacteraceae bacterium]|nr:protein-tyrosine phosphatase [Solirubrobacteraceae bacterium]